MRSRLEPLERLLYRHSQGDGRYGYVGTVEGLGWWSGGIEVAGTGQVSEQGTQEAYELDLVYAEVETARWTLRGPVRAIIAVEASPEAVWFRYGLEGELRVRPGGRVELDCAYDSEEGWSGWFGGVEAAGL